MAWDFSTDPEFQNELDWIDTLVREEIEPLDVLFPGGHAPYEPDTKAMPIVKKLQAKVRERGLWACHLPPALGGMGFGNVKLALINEILGRSLWAPRVFGCQAPDSGNAEILAHYGTPEQKDRYLAPLLAGEIVSTYSMTEPQGGADPSGFTCRARKDGAEWVIDGDKWFASNFPMATFVILMAVTDPDVSVYRGSSMILVPVGTPGMEAIRNVGMASEPQGEGVHGYLRFTECRVPLDNLLGPEGGGFELAQTRLGGGRLHHAMRSVGTCKKAIEMMCERALSRKTLGGPLTDQQSVRHAIADSWIQLEQFRMQVMYAAWQADQHGYRAARRYIAGVKVATPRTVVDIAYRALQLHGSLGASNEMPFSAMMMTGVALGLADGPTEVHKDVVARQILKDHRPSPGLFPTGHIPTRVEAARQQYGDVLNVGSTK
jgi:acyl-CoA dehydrogenase